MLGGIFKAIRSHNSRPVCSCCDNEFARKLTHQQFNGYPIFPLEHINIVSRQVARTFTKLFQRTTLLVGETFFF